MDIPENLATQGTQNEDKQNKNTTHYVLDSTKRKQTQITLIYNVKTVSYFNIYYHVII